MKRRRLVLGLNKITTAMLALSMTMGTFLGYVPGVAAKAEGEPYIVSDNRTVYASSAENSYMSPDHAVDQDLSSRWSSQWEGDTQWLYVDLGKVTDITGVTIHWEGAYATRYKIQYSNDEMEWWDVKQIEGSDGGIDDIPLTGQARYVRLYCQEKLMPAYGYSLYEFQVYGLNGLTKPLKDSGPNIALNKPVTASTESNIWWLLAYYPEGAAKPQNAVDGDQSTLWRSSEAEEDQWICIDLEENTEIGNVVLDWNGEGAGKYYDIQVSDDGESFTTIYRETKGNGGRRSVPIYANARYIRMYGYGKNGTSNGFWLNEFEVYGYQEGDEKVSYEITELPAAEVITAGAGSYLANDVAMPQPRVPLYKDDSLQAPLDSNDWWQSLLISEMGNMLSTLPLKVKYSKQGLGVLTATDGWLNDRSVVTEKAIDFYVMPGNVDSAKLYNEVKSYGDYSVTAVLRDQDNIGMESTIVKGSPYIFHNFNTREASIYSSTITEIFDSNNSAVLSNNGDQITADHIGIEITDNDNQDGSLAAKSYYAITVPEGTSFKRVGNKIMIEFSENGQYMSVAAMTGSDQLDYFFRHGYAFVTDTTVSYTFDESTSQVRTIYLTDTELKRAGFSDQTMQTLLPHQWKKTVTDLTEIMYPSVRGELRLHEGNTFETADTFYGIVPQFTLPANDEYSNSAMLQYLANLDEATKANLKSADAYWQGKSLHPLAMGLLAADQMGEGEYMDKFIGRLKEILEDWLTYEGEDDEFFLYYDPEWGSMYYRVSEFGANTGLTDHHFTYGYLVFAATVLATYDEEFYNDYKEMIEHMVRDYANPSDDDPLYPKFRNYDMYEGHSWAGGYADNDDGNNQEAAGESLFGWVGEYLWGVRTGNAEYKEAGIFGFTTELNAVEQYWFNYDGDNWIEDWTHTSVGQVYGATNFFGTFFHGDPVYVYGIHWLPTAEYLTSYGFDKEKAASLYQGLVDDVEAERAKRPGGIVDGPDDVWQHIAWPIQSLSNAATVLEKFDGTKTQFNETFNTYWFVNNLADLGGRVKDIWAINGASATVYEKDGVYQALAWNPGTDPVTIQFRDATGIVGSVTVKEKALVRVDPTVHTEGIVGNTTPPSKEGSDEYVPDTDGVNVALGKNVVASGSENDASAAENVVDGDEGTRWSSEHNDDQWIYVDLETAVEVTAVALKWEGAYARQYEIQTSLDGENWSTAIVKKNGQGGMEMLAFEPVTARYVKMQGMQRALPYGYSIWEMEVYLHSDSTLPVKNEDQETEEEQETNLEELILISAGNEAYASSEENIGTPAANVTDGDLQTRWSSAFTDDEWLTVNLGRPQMVSKVNIHWESSYARAYAIEVSADGENYTTVYETAAGAGQLEEIRFPEVSAQYVRIHGSERALPYGYSIYEIEVYGPK